MATPDNPNVVSSISSIVGAGLNVRTNVATDVNYINFGLGTTVTDGNGYVWMYVHANGAIGSNATVTLTFASRNSIDAASVLAKTTPYWVNGTAQFADQDYGWVRSFRRLTETNYKP